jgi:hypothetical protein
MVSVAPSPANNAAEVLLKSAMLAVVISDFES